MKIGLFLCMCKKGADMIGLYFVFVLIHVSVSACVCFVIEINGE